MNPKEHDRVFAAVSHLPHILAFSLVNTLSGLKFNNQSPFKFAGEGFKDFTRIAQSSPSMWHDIVLENRDQILASMDSFQSYFAKIKKIIEKGEGKRVEQEFSKAQKIRRKVK
jgi:prephenate dehydrogenase